MTCCGALEKITEDYGLPFERPIQIDSETHNLKRGPWAIRLLKITTSGNISTKPSPLAILKYCPFCGKKIEENKEEGAA